MGSRTLGTLRHRPRRRPHLYRLGRTPCYRTDDNGNDTTPCGHINGSGNGWITAFLPARDKHSGFTTQVTRDHYGLHHMTPLLQPHDKPLHRFPTTSSSNNHHKHGDNSSGYTPTSPYQHIWHTSSKRHIAANLQKLHHLPPPSGPAYMYQQLRLGGQWALWHTNRLHTRAALTGSDHYATAARTRQAARQITSTSTTPPFPLRQGLQPHTHPTTTSTTQYHNHAPLTPSVSQPTTLHHHLRTAIEGNVKATHEAVAQPLP